MLRLRSSDLTYITLIKLGYIYFVHSATTNTFKLSESHSNCGDASAVNISALSSDGTKQTFTSLGKYGKGQTSPSKNATKYDGS